MPVQLSVRSGLRTSTAARTFAPHDHALARSVLAYAEAQNYRFITPTPLTHARVLTNRPGQKAASLRDIFGWNMPFAAGLPAPELASLMQQAGLLAVEGELLRSTVRIGSVQGDLFLHSAYPTSQDDAVFFGPDTYRFIRFVQQTLTSGLMQDWATLRSQRPLHILDVGSGSGAGGIAAARALAAAGFKSNLVMNDINPLALQYTAINAAQADIPVTLAEGDFETATGANFDLIISNPPYMADPARRAYRHGGDDLGRTLSVRIAACGLKRLAPGGAMLLYTGVAMLDGCDPFIETMQPVLQATDCVWSYEEIDPDVFGEELEEPGYVGAERIAAVGLVVRRRCEKQ